MGKRGSAPARTPKTAREIGEIIGISAERIRQLRCSGYITDPVGRYSLEGVTQGYVRYLRARISKARRRPPPETLDQALARITVLEFPDSRLDAPLSRLEGP